MIFLKLLGLWKESLSVAIVHMVRVVSAPDELSFSELLPQPVNADTAIMTDKARGRIRFLSNIKNPPCSNNDIAIIRKKQEDLNGLILL